MRWPKLWRWHTHPRAAPPAEARRQDEVPVRRVSSPVATAACWRTLGASVSGTYHLRANRPCEDVSAVVGLDGGMVLAVADGAGSARQALLGATRAVSGACEAAVGALLSETVPASDEGWKELLIECVRAGRRAVERAGEPLHELASTLLLAILYGDTLAAAQVGDGWIVAKDGAGECRAVTVPGKGEYFNETVFVTSREYLETCSLRVEKASGLRGVAVLSDGLETAACDLAAGSPYAGFFDPLFRFAADSAVPKEEKRRRLEEFLSSERINSRTYDDKTLLLAVRDDVGAPSVDEPLPGGARGSDA